VVAAGGIAMLGPSLAAVQAGKGSQESPARVPQSRTEPGRPWCDVLEPERDVTTSEGCADHIRL
jgi:hypothetical protein